MEEGRGVEFPRGRKKPGLTFVAEDPIWTWHFLKLVAHSQGCTAAAVPGMDLV